MIRKEEEEEEEEEGVSRVQFWRQQDSIERLQALLERGLILQEEGGGRAQVLRVRFRRESAVGLRFIHKWLLGRYLFEWLTS